MKYWTEEEERKLIKQIRAFPGNLNFCFHAVAEQIGRTPGAIAYHWYAKTSKRKDISFLLVGSGNIARNRKNGTDMKCPSTIWNRIIHIVRSVFHA